MNEENEEQQKNPVVEQAKEQAKQYAKQQAKQAIEKAVKEAAKKAGQAIAKALASNPYVWIAIVAILLIIIIIAGISYLIDEQTVIEAAELMQGDLSQYVTIDDDHFEIDESMYEAFVERLEKQGLDVGSFLQKDSKYLKAIIKAELATTYPKLKKDATTNLSDNSFQGIVEIIRRSYEAEDGQTYYNGGEAEEILLEYMEPEKFDQKVANGEYEEVKKYYTISGSSEDSIGSSMVIKIATYNGSSIGTEQISYQNQINKYSVPVEFLISQLQVTQNPEYIYALADMIVNNSKIELVIQETYSYSYTHTVVNTKIETENGDIIITVTDEESESERIGIMKYIRKVDTWIVDITQEYTKKDTRYQEEGYITYNREGTFTYTKNGDVTFNATPIVSNEGDT